MRGRGLQAFIVLASEQSLVHFKRARGPSDVPVGLSVTPSLGVLYLGPGSAPPLLHPPLPPWQLLSPLPSWVSPWCLDFFPMHPSCFSVIAQLRVNDFCPLRFSSRDRNPQWGVRGWGGVANLPLGVISGKTDGLESQ